jgi:hypothetical protein
VTVVNPDQKYSGGGERKLTNATLKRMLGIDLDDLQDGWIPRQVVYRFEPDQRVEVVEDDNEGCFGRHAPH